MVSINKMLSCHAHFVLYLLQEIEFVVSVVSVALSGCTGGFVFNHSYWATIRALAFLNSVHSSSKERLKWGD